MSFGGLILTNEGRNELAKAEMGQTFTISKVILGEGKHNGSFMDIDALVSPVMFLDIKSMTRKDNEICLEVEYSTKDAPKAFYLREIGIIANEKLCYYDNSQEDAEYINPQLDNIIKQKRMRFHLLVSEAASVEATIASGLYAMANDLNEHIDDAIKHVSSEQTIAWDSMLEKSKEYTDIAYQQSTGYTDQAIADLIGGAPELRNTLKELSDAIDENGDIAEALNAAIGEKADQKVMESLLGQKLDTTGDTKGNTVSFTSSDTTTPSSWMDFDLFKSGDTIKAIMEKISIKARNLRYIWKLLGTTDISKIGDGTVTGAIDSLNSNFENIIVGIFENKKNGDNINLPHVTRVNSVVFISPRWNVNTTARCIFAAEFIPAGGTSFCINALDTDTGIVSTSNTLTGYYVVIPDSL